jgi:phosphatidylglycerophosphate synthase
MFVDQFKKYTDKLVPKGFLKFLCQIGLTGNRLTFLSFLSISIAGYLFWRGDVFWGGVLASLSWVFDFFDGKVARLSGEETKLGALFDFVSDRFRLVWLLALAFGSVITLELALVVLFLEAMLYLASHFIKLKKLRHPGWLPNNIHLLTFGALLNQVAFFLHIKIFLGGILLLFHLISAFWLNSKRNSG